MKWSNMGVCLWLFLGAWVPMANGQTDRADRWPKDVPDVVFDTPEKVDKSLAIPTELAKPVELESVRKPILHANLTASQKSNSEVKPTDDEAIVVKSVLEEPAEMKPTAVKLPLANPIALEPPKVKSILATPPVVVSAEAKTTISLPTVLQPIEVKSDLAETSNVLPVEVKPNLASTTVEAKYSELKPIVAEPTVEKSFVEIPILELEPNDALDLVELASNAGVPAEVESGSEPETFQTHGEAVSATKSATCSSDGTSSCRGSSSCGNHSCRTCNFGRWRGMSWGRVCDDRCSPLWCGCFEVRRPGSDVYHHMNAQVMNGLAAQMILYRYDFLDEQGHEVVALSRRGKEQLDKIVKRLETYGSPIVIEPTRHEQLDQQRRDEVLRQVSEWGIQIEPEMVVVGRPNPTGLAGPEAELIYGNMLQQTQSKGGNASGGSSVGNVFGSNDGSDNGGDDSSW